MLLSLTEHDPEAVARRIDENGIDVVENYVSAPALAQAQRFITETAHDRGTQSSDFDEEAARKNTFLDAWHGDASFIEFCRKVSHCAYEHVPPHPDWRDSLRVLSGKNGQSNSLLFHLDSYVLTTLIPILMPGNRETAQLILVQNARSIRQSYFINVVDKLIVDSPLSQYWLRRKNKNNRLQKVPLVPGNLYLFWGYRSIHANDAFDPDETRCTAIMHFYEHHRKSKLKRLLSAFR